MSLLLLCEHVIPHELIALYELVAPHELIALYAAEGRVVVIAGASCHV